MGSHDGDEAEPGASSGDALPAGAFSQLGWAFLFLGLFAGPTLRLGNEVFLFDVLPDWVGYLLIAAGTNRLLGLAPALRAVRNLSLALAVLAIPLCVQYMVLSTTPGTVATAMFHAGVDADGKPLAVARTDAERLRQHGILTGEQDADPRARPRPRQP